MIRRRPKRYGFAWLEVLLALAAVALVLQLFPAFGRGALSTIDVRNWSRATWFAVNFAAFLALLSARFVPILFADWRERHERLALAQSRSAKQQTLKERRETLARIKAAKKRRIY